MKDFTVEVGPEQPQGSRTRRSVYGPESLTRIPAPGIHTLYDVLVNSVRWYGDKNGFGFRYTEKMIKEEENTYKTVRGRQVRERRTLWYPKLSEYTYLTYKEVCKLAHDLGAGLVKLGIKEKSMIAMLSPTNVHCLIMAHGCFTQNMTIVTIHDTLGQTGLICSLQETEAVAIYTVGDTLLNLSRIVSRCSKLKYIIYSGEVTPGVLKKVSSSASQKVISLNALVNLGKRYPIEPKQPEPEDLCSIMYTAGSTGDPKGVMLSHKNIIASIAGVHEILGHRITKSDSMLAYLPFSHIMEFITENLCIFWGVTLGYGSVRTLTDHSVRRCKGDIKEFRPTLMIGTPLVWESIHKSILAILSTASPSAKRTFQRAFAIKAWLMKQHLCTLLIDRLIFNKFKETLGGRLRFALSGGAPLSVKTQKFLSVTLCPVFTGYGMTETSGMCSIMTPEQFGFGQVGSLVPCCEVKLVDAHQSNPLSIHARPQGEIWIRGPVVTKGYWKQKELTENARTEDGWFRTGDVAEWSKRGTLTVIDRISNLVKLSNGEYIALEKLEAVYKGCLFVDHVCVYADPLSHRPVALAAMSQLAVRRLAIEKDVRETDWKTICESPVVKKAVFEALLDQAKEARLCNAETIVDVHLCPELWTTEVGILTAAQKLKRTEIVRAYKKELDDMIAKQR
ncbi:hypothetical protein G6F62_004661 [Rhizopus arrhizus]|nr:hypothetical protein G6F62_004661 [Rhizopus arrhizus]